MLAKGISYCIFVGVYKEIHELRGRNAAYNHKINILDSDYGGRVRALKARPGRFSDFLQKLCMIPGN